MIPTTTASDMYILSVCQSICREQDRARSIFRSFLRGILMFQQELDLSPNETSRCTMTFSPDFRSSTKIACAASDGPCIERIPCFRRTNGRDAMDAFLKGLRTLSEWKRASLAVYSSQHTPAMLHVSIWAVKKICMSTRGSPLLAWAVAYQATPHL